MNGSAQQSSSVSRSSRRTKLLADPPRRGRRPVEVDHFLLLSEAAKLFDRKGYDQTTVDDIAKAIGISKPTVYNFYRSKTDLLNAIFVHIINGSEEILDEVEEIDDFRAALKTFIASSLRFGAAHRSMMNVFMSDERSLPEAIRKRHAEWSRETYHRLRKIAEQAQSRADPVDARVMTFAITAFINQVGTWFSHKGDLTLDEVGAAFWDMVERGVR